MSGYIDQNLHPGEVVEYRGRMSLAAALVKGVVMFVLGQILFSATHNAAVAFIEVIGLIWIVKGILLRQGAEYAVTDRRVIGKYGVIRQHSVDVLMTSISGVGVDKTLLARMFGYGTVWVNGSGTRRVLWGVADPLAFQSAVHKRLDDSRLLKGAAAYTLNVRSAPEAPLTPPTMTPPPPPSAAVSAVGRFCTHCGSALGTAMRFCGGCGAAAG